MSKSQKHTHLRMPISSDSQSMSSMLFTSYDHGWSLLVLILIVVSIWSILSFTFSSYAENNMAWLVGDEEGSTKSISEMIVHSEGKLVARSYACLNTSMIVMLAFYCCHAWPRQQVAYKAYPKLLHVQFFSFVLTCSSVQNAITITYQMYDELHFVYAALLYIFATVTIVVSTFQEYKYFKSNKNCRLQDKCRCFLNLTASIIMLLTWLLFLFSTFTYRSIGKIDRRPPVIWAELTGILGILFYCVSLLPYLDHEIGGAFELKSKPQVRASLGPQDNL